MRELFEQILGKEKFSEDEKKKIADEFTGVIVLNLISISSTRLTDQDHLQLSEYLLEQKTDQIILHLQGKYSEKEWKRLLKKEVAPLFRSYLNEVVGMEKESASVNNQVE